MVAQSAIWLLFFSMLTMTMAFRCRRQTVQLPTNGSVKGVVTKNSGRKIYEFRGIKYGKPPSGEARFKKSEPAEMENPTIATVFPRPCPRLEPVPREVSMPLNVTDGDQIPKTPSPLEDCLFLNIFSRDVSSLSIIAGMLISISNWLGFTSLNTLGFFPTFNVVQTIKLRASNPVIVFLEGSSLRRNVYYTLKGDYLLMGNVVLVVVQFRAGHLGFITDFNEDMPGNVALWDQILALQWVKNNIKSFGGDPGRVTLAGNEMGAVCAHLLSQSDEAKNLFQKLILLNGAGTVPWGIDKDSNRSNALMSEAAQCESDKAKCLRERSVATLDGAYRNVMLKNSGYRLRGCSPILQCRKNYTGVTVRLDPAKCNGNPWGKTMPTMLGFSKHAGLFIAKDEPYVIFSNPDIAPVAIKRYISEFLNLKPSSPVVGKLYKKYFKPEDDGTIRYQKTGLVDFISATGFKMPLQQAAECTASRGGNVYVFTFNYRSDQNKEGVDCGSEILYLFPSPWYKMTRKDRAVSIRLVTLINNFVTYGDPTSKKGIPPKHARQYPKWQPYQMNKKSYYVISNQMRTTNNMEKEFTAAMSDRIEKSKVDGAVSLRCSMPVLLLLLLLEACLNRSCV